MSEVLKLRKALLKKKEALLGSEKPEWLTGEIFRPNEFSQRGAINIRSSSAAEILDAYKSLRNHDACAKDLGLESKLAGFTSEQYIIDFKTRIAVLNRSENLKAVAALEAKIQPLLTVKEKRAIGTEELAADIEGLG